MGQFKLYDTIVSRVVVRTEFELQISLIYSVTLSAANGYAKKSYLCSRRRAV